MIELWLEDIVKKLPSYIQDSTHMLQQIEEWNTTLGPFDENTNLVTIDVKALYTNIPYEDMLTALKHFLEIQDKTNSSIPPTSVIIELVEHILKNNYFMFEGQCYKQIFGTAMGTPMAPSVANLFMGWLEAKILEDSPVPIQVNTWKRFIDDIFLLWNGSEKELMEFTNHINTYHPTIKFTVSSGKEIPFLDILIEMKDGYLHTDIYEKPTDVHGYLQSNSCHPSHTIRNLPFGLFIRLRRLCSEEDLFIQRCNQLEAKLKRRGHRQKDIARAREKVSKIPRPQSLQYKQERNSGRVPFVITHHPGNPPLSTWLHNAHQLSLRKKS